MTRIASVVLAGLFVWSALGQVTKSDPQDRKDENKVEPREPTSAGAGEQQTDKPPAAGEQRTTRQLLAMRLARVELDEAPLELVVEELATYAGTNIVVRWQRLEAVGIDRDTPVSLRVRNLRLSQILWMVLNQAAESGVKLAYSATPNLVVITTAAEIEQDMIIRVYDVRDLIVSVPFAAGAFFGGTTDVVRAVDPRGADGLPTYRTQTVDSGSVRLFTYGNDEDRFREEMENGPDRNMQQLIDVIVNTIEPQSWSVNGGAGVIRPWQGRLIIRNSPLVHQKIGGPLPDGEFP